MCLACGAQNFALEKCSESRNHRKIYKNETDAERKQIPKTLSNKLAKQKNKLLSFTSPWIAMLFS